MWNFLRERWQKAPLRRRVFVVHSSVEKIVAIEMKETLIEVPGSIVAPLGFLTSGVFCNIKRLGTGKGSNKGKKRDLALIVSTVPATAAGMLSIGSRAESTACPGNDVGWA